MPTYGTSVQYFGSTLDYSAMSWLMDICEIFIPFFSDFALAFRMYVDIMQFMVDVFNLLLLLMFTRAEKQSGPPNGLFNRLTMMRISAVNFR